MDFKFVCGRCALDRNLSLEERKALAVAVVVNQIYRCPDCLLYFKFDGYRWHKQYHAKELL
jgi:hypothetical protein